MHIHLFNPSIFEPTNHAEKEHPSDCRPCNILKNIPIGKVDVLLLDFTIPHHRLITAPPSFLDMQIAQPPIRHIKIFMLDHDASTVYLTLEIQSASGITIRHLLEATETCGYPYMTVRKISPISGFMVSVEAENAMLAAGEKGMYCIPKMKACVKEDIARKEFAAEWEEALVRLCLARNGANMLDLVRREEAKVAAGTDVGVDVKTWRSVVERNISQDRVEVEKYVKDIWTCHAEEKARLREEVEVDVWRMLAGFDREVVEDEVVEPVAEEELAPEDEGDASVEGGSVAQLDEDEPISLEDDNDSILQDEEGGVLLIAFEEQAAYVVDEIHLDDVAIWGPDSDED
jgi:hypothetical protein